MSATTKRFYVLPIIGSGTREDAYRPQFPSRLKTLADGTLTDELAVSWAAIIPSDKETGRPLHKVALVKSKGTSEKHEAIRNMVYAPIDLETGIANVDGHGRLLSLEAIERKNRLLETLRSKGKLRRGSSTMEKPVELEESDAKEFGRVLSSELQDDWMSNFDVN